MTDRREAIRLAEQLISQGKYERAIEAYEDLLKENPDDIALHNALGDLYVRVGLGEKAVPYFRKVADRYKQSGFRKKAIATLKKAHRQAPADTSVVERLASLHIQEGLAAEARRLLLELARHHQQHNRLPEAREVYRKVVEIDPHCIPALLKLSELASSEGDSEAEYAAYCAVGRELVAAGRLQEAVGLLIQAHEADPEHREATKLLADLFRESGELDKAIELYKRLLETDPRDAELLAAMGEIALEDGDEKATTDHFHRAREIDPESERVLLLGSRIACKRGDFATALVYLDPLVNRLFEERREGPAIAALEEIAARAPDHVETLEKLKSIYIFLGNKERLANLLVRLSDALEEAANYAGAIEAAEQLQGLEPDKLAHKGRLERLHGLMQGAVMFGDDEQAPPETLAEAEEAGSAALAVESEVDPAIDRILLEADTFLRYGLRKKARERLEAALVINADNAVLHQRLAKILVDEEELEAAVQSFARAADLWEERGKPDMAAPLKMAIAELVTAGAEPLPEPSPEPKPEPAAAEAEELTMDTLEGQIAEAEYYLDQNFLSPAHQLLSSLRERNPDHPELEKLWDRLCTLASVELDAAEVEKDLDDFFSPLESEAGGGPAPATAVEESITTGLEKELYALHGAAERRLNQLNDKRKVDAERILSHLPTGAADSLMQKDFAIHFELGAAYMETGLLEEAITEFQLAAEDPDLHQKACLNLGSCFRQRGMDSAALVWLERGFTAGGDEKVMAETLFNMALIHKAHGKQEKFESAVEQLKALAPEHPGLESLRDLDS